MAGKAEGISKNISAGQNFHGSSAESCCVVDGTLNGQMVPSDEHSGLRADGDNRSRSFDGTFRIGLEVGGSHDIGRIGN